VGKVKSHLGFVNQPPAGLPAQRLRSVECIEQLPLDFRQRREQPGQRGTIDGGRSGHRQLHPRGFHAPGHQNESHGLPGQLGIEITAADQGNFYTRSMVGISWIEKILIGSLSAGYHHEHHIFPNIPFYNLARLNERIGPEVAKRGPMIYARGYFSAAILNPKRFIT